MSNGPEYVHYEQDGPVVVITIDRPERMNAIGPEVPRAAGRRLGAGSATTTRRWSAS